ncbi:MAG: SpoIIE family protein phosphatase [Spirochaetes bacterium]|nr:SpoIIE family protein phosphatase [Spirochaetota bacterium]
MLQINIISPLLAGILLTAISMFVIIKDWRSQLSRYYVYYNISAIGILVTMFLTYAYPENFDITLLNKLTQTFTLIFFGSFFAVSVIFPKSESYSSIFKIVLVMAPAVIIGIIIVITDLTITRAYFEKDKLVRNFQPFYIYYSIVVVLYLSAGIVNFVRKYVKIKVQIYKIQIRYVFIGGSIAFILAIFCSIVLPTLFDYTGLYTVGPSIGAFISAVSLFYAVIAYNLMGIKTAVYKTIIYIIQFLLIIMPIGVLLILYHNKAGIFDQMPLYLISGIIVLYFILFAIKVIPMIDRAFQRTHYAMERLLENLIKETAHIKNVEDIIVKLTDVIFESLSVKNIYTMLFNKNTKTFDLFYFKGKKTDIKPIDVNSQVIKWLARGTEVLNVENIFLDEKAYIEIKKDIMELFFDSNIKIILPVFNDKQIIGIICLGEKNSIASYKADEIGKLQRFNIESSRYITNAIDYAEWNQGQFESGILDLSSEILSKAVPVHLPRLQGLSFGAFYIPRYREGIDYFDFIMPTNIGAGVIATDISGRGINNALYSVILRSAFHSCMEDAHSTYTTMQRLNKAVYAYTKGEGGIVKAYYFYYDIYTMRLIYTNAGFQPLEIYRLDKNFYESLDTEGFPLGTDLNANYGMGRTNLLLGDIGFLYSRSFIDSKNQNGEKFGLTQLRKIIKEYRQKHPSEIAGILKDEFLSFMGLSSPDSNILVIIFKA